jgi:glutathione S-transferase
MPIVSTTRTVFMQFKLYHWPGTRSARVKWLLHELVGDAFTVEIVKLRDGVQYGADYLHKNPNHCVPTLEIGLPGGGPVYMIESGAMIVWLADLFPEKRLAPRPEDALRRADYLQMLQFGASWMDMMLWQIRIHEHILRTSEKDPRTVRRYRSKFTNEVEPQLRARLASTKFICGDAFSAADCMIGHNLMWARRYDLCSGSVFEHYVARIRERPACISAFADVPPGPLTPAPEDSAIARLFTG